MFARVVGVEFDSRKPATFARKHSGDGAKEGVQIAFVIWSNLLDCKPETAEVSIQSSNSAILYQPRVRSRQAGILVV
jgi:hypothetical protein